MKSTLIMAGGTGGHIFPALAVARALKKQGVSVHWLGTRHGLENRIVPEAGFAISYIAVTGLRGKGVKQLLLAPFQLIYALYQAISIVRRVKPDVVLGMGGFASGPGGLAAWLLRKPLVIHEQNAAPGVTNRLLARLATTVLQAFPQTFAERYGAITTGNPVRKKLLQVASPVERYKNHQQRMHLLVMGGSQGALAINELVPQLLAKVPDVARPEIWHLSGKRHVTATKQAYETAKINAKIEAFKENMIDAYEWADLVLCRAGALTIAELTAVGVASILIPFPFAVDDHQTRNGKFLVDAQAAVLIPQRDLNIEKLSVLLCDFAEHRENLVSMAMMARKLSHKNATQDVIKYCQQACIKTK